MGRSAHHSEEALRLIVVVAQMVCLSLLSCYKPILDN